MRRYLTLLLALLLLFFGSGRVFAQPPATPAADTNTTADVLKVQEEATATFLARYPAIAGAYPTRLGNSAAGTAEATKIWGHSTFPDGAPVRLAIPQNASRVGLETGPDGKVLLRVHSDWNEGGPHDTYIDPTSNKIVGGLFDVPFPRTDYENRTPENAWQYGTGLWMAHPAWSRLTDAAYRAGVPFRELRQGPDSGVPGYSWSSGPGGLVIKTPKTTIYSTVAMGAAVSDPGNANLVFSQYNSHTLNWGSKGSGKEEVSFAPSFDFTRYPTDPRRIPAKGTHPVPLAAVRVGGNLYVLSGANEILVHRWDAESKILAPVAAAYFRPDELPDAIPGKPTITWGQGAIVRAGPDGNFAADRWQVINALHPFPLWNGYLYDIDPDGVLYFLPSWREIKDAGDGATWRTLDPERGTFALENLKPLVLPDALKTAPQCAQIRIDWKSGDLVAVAQRGGVWNLERYPKWRDSPKTVRAAYSVGPVALSLRREYHWSAKWNAKWGASVGDSGQVPTAGFGTMRVQGDYVFIAEAQAGGVRIHRLSDGSIVGRVADRLHLNSTIDDPTQLQVTESSTEYRLWLMDFNGKAVQIWRIPKASLR